MEAASPNLVASICLPAPSPALPVAASYASAKPAGMAEDALSDMEALVKGAWASTERPAMEVVGYPASLRDQ